MEQNVITLKTLLICSTFIFIKLFRRYGLYFLILLVIFTAHWLLLRRNSIYKAKEESLSLLSKQLLEPGGKDENLQNVEFDNHNKDEATKNPMYSNLDMVCSSVLNNSTLSAIRRARSPECKKKIATISCQIDDGSFYPSRLSSSCPDERKQRKSVGCYLDSTSNRLLRGHYIVLSNNSPSLCADICYQNGFKFAGVEYGKECFCDQHAPSESDRVPDSDCSMDCSGSTPDTLKCGGFLRLDVWNTGYVSEREFSVPLKQPLEDETLSKPVRVAFVLTLNGRSLRQVLRLFKALYHKDHYFFIHVDARQHYLHRELLKLEKQFPNVLLSKIRFTPIWGGSSLLKMLLNCMKELMALTDWQWDFIINLSETDYPLKTNAALVRFLSANRDRNFLRSHGQSLNVFLKKQGLFKTFVECDNHMWRIGSRELPLGILYSGGSDWIGLNREFVEYVSTENELIEGLKKIFFHSLLPAETFFHTVLLNSKFCSTFADSSLRTINWKRKFGCRCQYKHIVDWCGCSPNAFTTEDWPKIERMMKKPSFFGRKFEAVKDLKIINKVDEFVFGGFVAEVASLASYWDNIYHFEDPPSDKDVDLTLFHAATRLGSRLLEQSITPEDGQEDTKLSVIFPVQPTQVHTYHFENRFEGLVVEFLAKTRDGDILKAEAILRPKNLLQLSSAIPYSAAIEDMRVNINFDLKEQIFRNFGGQLGPFSELQMVIWWTESSKELVEKGNLGLDVLVVDPLQLVAGYAFLKVEDTAEALVHKFNLNRPLRPGVWSLYVLNKGEFLASVQFSILPLEFFQGRRLSPAETAMYNNGTSCSPSPLHEDSIAKFANSLGIEISPCPGNLGLLEKASTKAALFDHELLIWIDDSVETSYAVNEVCLVGSDETHRKFSPSVPNCRNVSWSSHSSDPKTFWGNLDPETGRLKDLPYPKKKIV